MIGQDALIAHPLEQDPQLAKELGISRFALQRKLDKYGVDKNGHRTEKEEESEEVVVEDG